MRNLLYKEFRLTACPLTYFFILFAVMTLIPGYPILVGSFFVCMGIFYSFQYGREYNDITFSVMLPVAKKDIVTEKYLFTIIIELAAWSLMALLTLLRYLFMSGNTVYVNNALMNANMAYLGWSMLIFAAFNIVFLGMFFKTAYNVGKPFLVFGAVAFLIIGVAETMHFLPGLGWLNATDSLNQIGRLYILLGGIVIYGTGSWLAMRKSQQRFERLDL